MKSIIKFIFNRITKDNAHRLITVLMLAFGTIALMDVSEPVYVKVFFGILGFVLCVMILPHKE